MRFLLNCTVAADKRRFGGAFEQLQAAAFAGVFGRRFYAVAEKNK